MNGIAEIQEKLRKALEALKSHNLDDINIKPGNIESLAKAQQNLNIGDNSEITDALQGIHSVIDELNNHALNLLNNIDHKMVVKRREPKKIKIDDK